MSTTPQVYKQEQTALVPNGNVIVVQRNDDQLHVGQGMVKGMLTVIKHFGESFRSRLDDKSDIAGMFTVEYPEERMELPETFRNMPILLYDDKTGHELCTSCFQCERVCPPKVIHITQAVNPETGKPVPAAEEFVIEYDSCMSCGYCHEICPFDAIKMDHTFELSTADHLSMDVRKRDLNRPISYYQTIAPNLWAEVEANAMKKLQNNIKRRPGTIGIAPHLVGKIQQAAPTVKAATPARAAATPSAPVAAIGKHMPPEKVERLKAIRAANAAKRSAAVPAAEATPVAASVPVAGTTPTTDAPPESAQVATTGPVAAMGKNMSEEKRARLEAIRAAKRAQREQGGG
jgi:NADH-quinone oxidoreductase subunit I